ncbi:MAG: aminotransferase class IV [Ignavibacteriales bacterium]|nr:aminotransferase class IV [Ignavibacteriales bacterium]
MSLLLESICYTPEGFRNLDRHIARMERSGAALYPGHAPYCLREKLLKSAPVANGTIKCRVLYDSVIREVQYAPYQPKVINSFKIVASNNLDYTHKYADRSALDALKNGVAEDEIIIVHNGLLTDASYANIIFFDGEKWLTPSKPLLQGIMREKLLVEGKIFTADISPTMLRRFVHFKLINAMLGMEESTGYAIEMLV